MAISWRSLALALLLAPLPAAAGEAADQWSLLAALGAEARAAQVGQRIGVEVDLDPGVSPGFGVGDGPGGREVRYRMAFNNIAEGWSWQPGADPAREDYYRYKFLPLESAAANQGRYEDWSPFDGRRQIVVRWRYDYFLAFDNLYDFYPRTVDDDAGFAAPLPAGARPPLRMRAVATLTEPVISESTTFWKAAHDQPLDFTLKKRYLVGHLEEVSFLDADGKTVATLRPAPPPDAK